jgi:hypothetical protein
MKPFITALLASAFAMTATLALAQSDPHHPAAEAGDASAITDDASPGAAAAEPQQVGPDAACPNSPSMMMDASDAAMPMMQMMGAMQMMQATQLEMMRSMTMMQEQMALMQKRIEEFAQEEGNSP